MLTSEALAGELRKTGQSGRVYIFGFGWACRWNLETVYGPGMAGANEEYKQDPILQVANVLMCALKTKSANNLPEGFDRQQMYSVLDDIGETGVEEAWEVAKKSLGFFDRLLGINREAIEKLAQQALALQGQSASQNQPIGTDSNA